MHPGDQHLPHNDKSGQSNPFTLQTPSITRISAQEIATLQAKLDRKLGPEYISDRPGAGGVRVQYLEAWKCINLANEIFGFNGWSSSIQNISVDYMDENRETGRVSLGLSVVVRVTLKDGVYHEDIGYGSIDNAKSKAAAFEKCKKEGTTDALKRALRNFGNVLGNCLYDKSYLREVSKVKAPAPRFDLHELHRRPEFAPAVKTVTPPHPPPEEPIANTTLVDQPVGDDNLFQDQFDDNYFDDYDFEDRPILVESPRLNEFETDARHTRTRTTVTPVKSEAVTAFNNHQQNANMVQQVPAQKNTTPSVPRESPTAALVPVPNENVSSLSTKIPQQPVYRNAVEQQSVEHAQLPGQTLPSTVGFSRVGGDGTPLRPYNPQAGFSPYATSKSNGIDYSKSTPIPRTLVQKGPLNNSDAHNRMAQVPPSVNQNSRLVGCPPNRQYSPALHSNSPHRPGVHIRVNSGHSLGVKRNIHEQYTSEVETAERTTNQGQMVAQPDPKRVRN